MPGAGTRNRNSSGKRGLARDPAEGTCRLKGKVGKNKPERPGLCMLRHTFVLSACVHSESDYELSLFLGMS
jgi:hypothetical protein